ISRSKKDIVPANIQAAYLQKGGWEGKAYIEIAYLVSLKYRYLNIDCEVNVYEGIQRDNDFGITHKNNQVRHKQIIELKSERGTHTPVQSGQSFTDDVAIINSLPIDAKYRPAQVFVVAITCTDATYELLFETE
ncbi:MAG: hypothetical protein Q9202_006410, partial [Teloschistes flavicans]